jgi:hypothetical protein
MSRECGSIKVSQPYGPPQPAIGVALHEETMFDSVSSKDMLSSGLEVISSPEVIVPVH